MEQFRQQIHPWAFQNGPASRSSNMYNNMFSNAFPLNLINKKKIHVDFDYDSVDEDERDYDGLSTSRDVAIQRVEDPCVSPELETNNIYDDLPELEEAKVYSETINFPKIELFVPPQLQHSTPKSYVLGYVSSDAVSSTPEDDQFIANYMKQHSSTEIQRALAVCKKEYLASVNQEEKEEDRDEDYDDHIKGNREQYIVANWDNMPDPTRQEMNNISENPITYTPDGFVNTDISISSDNFAEIFAGVPLVKLTNESCCHNGMTFVEGENVDHNEFKYDHSCGPDGIYFCRLDDMFNWLDYSASPMYWMWDAEVPDGARAVMYNSKLKANRLILTNKRRISDYVTSKLISMVVNGEDIDEVFDLINRLTPTTRPDAQSMEDVYLAMLARDYNLFYRIPENSRTYNLSMFLALNDHNAYEKIKDETLSHEILMECIKNNSEVYHYITKENRSQEMANYMFSLDTDNYGNIDDEYKTLEMTEKYLSQCSCSNVFMIPSRFMKQSSIIPKIIAKNGIKLNEVEYKTKTYDLCRSAIQNNGMALNFTPFTMIDQTLCNEATVQTYKAYPFVPDQFRTPELKDQMVKADPYGVTVLVGEDLTHEMILHILSREHTTHLLATDMFSESNTHVKNLFAKHIREYINLSPVLYQYLDARFFSEEDAILMVKKNPMAYYETACTYRASTTFVVESVKAGVHFNALTQSSVTATMLNELVTARQSVIDELPQRFLSDVLYVICMRVHKMPLSSVPEEFRTSFLSRVALELYPAESEISVDQIEQSFLPVASESYPAELTNQDTDDGSISFDSNELSEDETF